MCFYRLEKAFDFLNCDCLWYKLLKSGVRGNIFDVMFSMYSRNVSKVKYQITLSDSFECNIGVRQGESLFPFLFSLV